MITKEDVSEGEYSQFDVITLLDHIAELEKERDEFLGALVQLKTEFVRCDNCGEQSECEKFDIFNGGTVDNMMQAHNLWQKAKGIEDALNDFMHDAKSTQVYVADLDERVTELRNQAKAIKYGE